MKRPVIPAVLLAALLLAVPAAAAEGEAPAAPAFPDLPGFAAQGEPRIYAPEVLFEYINGKADGYLDYGFEELASQPYAGEGSRKLTVDVYRHRDLNHAFGIYTSERPDDAVLRETGTEGYLDHEKLHFFAGRYYVKLAGAGLGDDAETVLMEAAGVIAAALEAEPGYPPTLAALPPEGRVPNSLRYVARGFLGHGFLCCAFTAEYEGKNGVFRGFVIEAADEDTAAKMLKSYENLVEKKGGLPLREGGIHRFHDPYRLADGLLNILPTGRYLVGVFQDHPGIADRMLSGAAERLAETGP